MMTQDELQVYAESLYETAAAQAQLAADNDIDRQIRVTNGLLERPTYAPWSAIPEVAREMWRHMAVRLEQQAEVHDALIGGI